MSAHAAELIAHPPTDWLLANFLRKSDDDEPPRAPNGKVDNAAGVQAMMAMFPGGSVKVT